MSGIIARFIGLRLVGTTKYITKQNTTKYLQSMCQVRNRCSDITKNPITPAQKESAGYWKTIKYYSVPLTILGMNIAIYCAYKIKTDHELSKEFNMLIAVAFETSKYSIIPSKNITSSVFFDDSEIRIKTREGNKLFVNDNTRNLIIGEELDANIQEPFPRGKPIRIKIGKINGLLDNGKLTLKDGDRTFNFHHTLSFEVKKTSTTLQDEIAAEEKEPSKIQLTKISELDVFVPDNYFSSRITAKEKKPFKIQQTKIDKFNLLVPDNELSLKISNDEYKWPDTTVDRFNPVYSDIFPTTKNFTFSSHGIVKIQADNSDEVFYLKQNVNFECHRKSDKNLQNMIVTKKLSTEDELPEATRIKFDSGVIVFKTQDGEKIIVKQRYEIFIFKDGEKISIDGKPYLTLV